MPKLTTKQQKFVDAYCGNATDAALKAGYSKNTAKVIGCENLTKPYILEAIKARQDKPRAKRIATREDRQAMWTKIMEGDDKDADMKDRLKASELLGRSEADFTDNLKLVKPTVIIKDLSGK